MDVLRLYQDNDVPFVTEGHKHTREGWVNVSCPFCTGNFGYHLGWNIHENYFSCFRCGFHSPVKTISALLKISINDTLELIKQYGVLRSFIKRKQIDKKKFQIPSNIVPLTKEQKSYLKNRNFNPNKIEKLWGVKGTSPTSRLEGYKYRFRLFIPIYWNGELVSFDTRDITNKQEDKYKACPKEFEAVEHKQILYGNQEEWGSTGICVEGKTDVWRFGTSAFGTDGIKFTFAQVRIIANTFKKVAVVYDDDPQAIRQAKKLVAELKFRNVEAYRIPIKGDPAEMSKAQAKNFVNKILNK